MKPIISQTQSFATAFYAPKPLHPPDRRACGGFAANAPLPAIRKILNSSPLRD